MMARREREALEMVEFARRAIKAAGRHVAASDEFELAELVSLRDVLEEAISGAVHGQMEIADRSWTYIGDALGMSRQGARQRYGEKVAS